jgi:hypothetical protein
MVIGGAVLVAALFFPVRIETPECPMSGHVGSCGDQGVSLVGIAIPGVIIGGAVTIAFIAALAFIGWRLDRKANAMTDVSTRDARGDASTVPGEGSEDPVSPR